MSGDSFRVLVRSGGFSGCAPIESGETYTVKLLNYWFVRLRVAQGLAKVKTKESRAVLHKLLKDEHEEVRKAAQESLNKINQVEPAR